MGSDRFYEIIGTPQIHKFFSENVGNTSLIERLEPSDCIAAYDVQFIHGRGDVLAVTSKPTSNNTGHIFMVWQVDAIDSDIGFGGLHNWICGDETDTPGTYCDVKAKQRTRTNGRSSGTMSNIASHVGLMHIGTLRAND